MSRLEEVASEATSLAKFLDHALSSSGRPDPETLAKAAGAAHQLRRHVAWLEGYAKSAEQMVDEQYPARWASFSAQAAPEGGAR